jgi:hypothetical protein
MPTQKKPSRTSNNVQARKLLAGSTTTSPKANKAIVIPQKVKLTEIEKELMKLKEENADLKERNIMLEKMFLTAGIEVDEKFGDNEDHIVFPSASEVKNYKDLGRAEEREAFAEDNLKRMKSTSFGLDVDKDKDNEDDENDDDDYEDPDDWK